MSHLRKAWKKRFPGIDEMDDNDKGNGEIVYLDEQEQDDLIRSLRAQNETINIRYKIAYTIFALVQVPVILFHPVLRDQQLHSLSILAVSSLLVTAYSVHTMPTSLSAVSSKRNILIGLNCVLAALVALGAYMRLRPLIGLDYLWFSPLGTVSTSLLVAGWVREGDVESLEKFRYKYKGA
ncbi:hypothetical protein V1512DRAFT_262660 [Lipomyces arxii]|uniref:uncharacterized protein n=1 Tax=Lipomyces arxii TaxID=56418 RepID=UPI0034CD1FAE